MLLGNPDRLPCGRLMWAGNSGNLLAGCDAPRRLPVRSLEDCAQHVNQCDTPSSSNTDVLHHIVCSLAAAAAYPVAISCDVQIVIY